MLPVGPPLVPQGVQLVLCWPVQVQQKAPQLPQQEVLQPLAGNLPAVLRPQGSPQRLKTASIRRLKSH